MPLQATSGAASYDAFGGGVPAVPNYIEDVFSTFLRVSDGTNTQAIVNNIDLSTKGGLVWSKPRAAAGENHILVDSARGVNKYLSSDLTSAQGTMGFPYVFNTNGFTSANGNFWANGVSLVDWTFRKQPKFFDIVTWTGNDVIGREIPHNLGSVPACIMVKQTNATRAWVVYHVGIGNTKYLTLNSTSGAGTQSFFNNTTPTSTVFTVGDWGAVNGGGNTYVAYLFAHDAGGFGLTGTDNVISCGSFSGNTTVTLGYEPQWIMLKRTDAVGNWDMHDVMRGWPVSGDAARLRANLSDAESQTSQIYPNATGFSTLIGAGNYIYIAIRRGPMKVPTSGTSVFSPITATSGTQTTGFPVDMQILSYRSGTDAFLNHQVIDRLRGVSSTSTPQGNYLNTTSTAAESNVDPYTSINMSNTGFQVGNNYAGASSVFQSFRRAPSFFDEVCYTGTGVAGRTVTHNLTVAPELMIVKGRSNAGQWRVYSSALGATQAARLNSTDSFGANPYAWNDTAPTASVFTVGDDTGVNENTYTYVAYLFATCAGVSKVGSYTGNGSSQTINCGFTGGARFVMVKATSTTGNWIVADSARGIVAGNDPALYLNSTAAEVTGLDWIDADNSGFVVNETATIAANTNGVSYIFFAVA